MPFREPTDYAKYQGLLQRYHPRYGFHLYPNALMPNCVFRSS
jgi:hypothetical protein